MVPCISFFLILLCFPFLSSPAQLNSSGERGGPDNLITWYNRYPINETIDYGNGYSAMLILKTNSSNPATPNFACAFICTGACNSYFLAVLILGKFNMSAINDQGGFPGLVWLANRDKPIGENGSLQLKSEGDLVLQDADGTIVWSTGTAGKSVVGLSLEETGNLVLYDGKNDTVWQSFDNPTDTLLPGQRLYEGQRLMASSSAKNWSSGKYYAVMTSEGFAAFIEADSPLMFFRLDSYSTWLRPHSNPLGWHALPSVVSDSSDAGVKLDGGKLLVQVNGDVNIFVVSPALAEGSYLYLRLGSDGHLRTYVWQESQPPREVFDLVAQAIDDCQYPYDCGDYGVCSNGTKCSCPKPSDGLEYFKPINKPFPNYGCLLITPLSCQSPPDKHHLVYFGNLSYFNFIDSDASNKQFIDLEGCKQACLGDCSCKAAFFEYGNTTSNGSCYFPTKILSLREKPIPSYGSNSTAFIKVQIPYSAPALQPATSISKSSKRNHHLRVIIAVSVTSAMIIIFIRTALCYVILRRKNEIKKETKDEGEVNFEQVVRMPKKFSYEELHFATDDFKEKLGGGGFGSVFEGTLRDGTKIAVKRLDNIGQGMKEFFAEVETIGNIHHFNLVRLIGFCAERSHRLLVYEYMSNGSLDKWIFSKDDNLTLDWQTRKKIILDVAKGLSYLHEDCRHRIVHLDIKPQNILLDENFNAKVSDFGLSKLMEREQSQVQTTLRGTPGYIAPEWQKLRITFKVDTYSFGIVVLEIVCGRKNLDRSQTESRKHLLRLLQEKAEENSLIEIVGGLWEEVELRSEEILKMIRLAAWCLQDDHTRRPLMSTVVKVLEGAMAVETNISYRFGNAMEHTPTNGADFHLVSEPPPASVLSGPR